MAGKAFEFMFLHQTHHRGQISQILELLIPIQLAGIGVIAPLVAQFLKAVDLVQ